MADQIDVTVENVKALAHPLRVQVLGQLRTYGPATATTLADRLGLSSGALSYHLRQLERFGFIVEDPDRGNKRERWWRAAHRSSRIEKLLPDADGGSMEEILVATAADALQRGHAALTELPEQWRQVFEISDYLLRLDPEQAQSLATELNELLGSYPQHDPDQPMEPGTRAVHAQFQLFAVPNPS